MSEANVSISQAARGPLTIVLPSAYTNINAATNPNNAEAGDMPVANIPIA